MDIFFLRYEDLSLFIALNKACNVPEMNDAMLKQMIIRNYIIHKDKMFIVRGEI